MPTSSGSRATTRPARSSTSAAATRGGGCSTRRSWSSSRARSPPSYAGSSTATPSRSAATSSSSARARVDGRPDHMVRAPAADGGAQRTVPRPSRRGHAVRRRLGRRARARRARRAERFTDGMLNQIATGQALYRQGEIHRLQGGRTRRSGCSATPTTTATTPSPGWRWCGSPRDGPTSLPRCCVAPSPSTRASSSARPCSRRTSTVMLAIDDADTAAAAARQLQEIADRQAATCSARSPPRPRRPSCSPRATTPAALTRCPPGRAGAGRPWRRRTTRPGPGSWSAARCTHLGDEESAAMELAGGPHGVRDSRRRARRRERRRADRAARRTRTACRRASWRCCATWPRRQQPGDRRRPRDQRAHRGPARPEHLRQARRGLADRGGAYAFEHHLV